MVFLYWPTMSYRAEAGAELETSIGSGAGARAAVSK